MLTTTILWSPQLSKSTDGQPREECLGGNAGSAELGEGQRTVRLAVPVKEAALFEVFSLGTSVVHSTTRVRWRHSGPSILLIMSRMRSPPRYLVFNRETVGIVDPKTVFRQFLVRVAVSSANLVLKISQKPASVTQLQLLLPCPRFPSVFIVGIPY